MRRLRVSRSPGSERVEGGGGGGGGEDWGRGGEEIKDESCLLFEPDPPIRGRDKGFGQQISAREIQSFPLWWTGGVDGSERDRCAVGVSTAKTA